MTHYSLKTDVNKIRTKAVIALTAISLVLGGSGLSLALLGNANAASNNAPQCGSGKQIVNVTYGLYNDYDSGFAGNAWANDTISRHLQIFDGGSGTFCATVNDTGSFVTFAGPSPSGSATVAAGNKGVINGGYTTTVFTGTLNPSPAYSTHGNLGSFDLQCTDAYNCSGVHPTYSSYINITSGDGLASWGWTYHTAQNGNWVNASAGSTGDITN